VALLESEHAPGSAAARLRGIPPRRRRPVLRALAFVLGGLAALAAVAVGLAFLAFPQAQLDSAPQALARLHLPGLGTRLVSLHAFRADNRPLPVRLTNKGWLWPRGTVRAGEPVHVTVVVRRPGWIGWLIGDTQREQLTVVAPEAKPVDQWLEVTPGNPIRVSFDQPVRVLALRRGKTQATRTLAQPRRVVTLPPGFGGGLTGTVHLSTATRTWERLSAPVKVDWFPSGYDVSAVVKPGLGKPLPAGQPLILTLSKPVSDVFGSQTPRLVPNVPGRWRTLDDHTLAFVPSRFGFTFGSTVTVRLPSDVALASARGFAPRGVLRWHVPLGSQERVQQLLAQLGYLPLAFTSKQSVPANYKAQLDAAFAPPAGQWAWRWASVPAPLRAMWQPGNPNNIDHGALMAFQNDHGLTPDGVAGPIVWRALLAAVMKRESHPVFYSYVQVSRSLPEHLTLWHNGATVLTAPANTGISQAPTVAGTFPVYEHIPVGTMSGTNPDGSHYNDPGIRYISYFNGGDAIHAFDRASFGSPQSLGCVELELGAAASVYPYTPIGTLVTVS